MRKTTFALLVVLGLLMTVPAFAAQEIFGDPIIIKEDWDGAVSVYAIDIDGDLDADIVAAAFYADEIRWWENQGDKPPTFSEHIISGSFEGARSVHAADVDGDGDVDVVGAAQVADDITWWENDPSGDPAPADPISWTEHTIKGNFDAARCVYAADLDRDGDDGPGDIDILGAADQADDITWWENDGGTPPNFTERTIKGDFNYATSVYAADVDGDGYTDVVGTAHYADDITWWENDGGTPPNFTEHTIEGDFHWVNNAHAADVDGDGDVDVLGTSGRGSQIIWWENDPSGDPPPADPVSWTKHTITDEFYGANSVYAVNIDGDNYMDVVATASGDCEIAWWESTPSGNPPPGDPFTWTKHLVHYDERKPHGVYAADLDDDEDPDIVAAVHHGGYVAWWENLGPPTIAGTVDINPDTLNLKSKGPWVMAYIELPEGHEVADIDVGSVLLEDSIPAASHPTGVGDHDQDGIADLVIKFSRQDLIDYLKANGLTSGDVELAATGYVDSVPFEGTDSIRVR